MQIMQTQHDAYGNISGDRKYYELHAYDNDTL